jgi:hypothetical protein
MFDRSRHKPVPLPLTLVPNHDDDSDEGNESPFHHIFIPFGAMGLDPSQIPQDVKDILHKSEMASEDLVARIDEMFEDMKPENIALLKLLFGQAKDNPDYCTWMVGLLTGMLKFRHQVCISCGRDHATELANEGVTPPDDTE